MNQPEPRFPNMLLGLVVLYFLIFLVVVININSSIKEKKEFNE
jgi:hypothetical protein